MIEFKDVALNIDGKEILKDLNTSFEMGKTHVILGKSGHGKSTILRLIRGLIAPTAGDIFLYGGQRIKDLEDRFLCEKMGWVVQNGGLFPHLTGLENIFLTAKSLGKTKEFCTDALDRVRSVVNIDSSLLEKYPVHMSGGQRQRISLMRALLLDPEVILLDEPLSGLDPIHQVQLVEDLSFLFEKLKKTVVFVTHFLWVAAELGETVSFVSNGKIIQQSSFDELKNSPVNEDVEEFFKVQVPYLKKLI